MPPMVHRHPATTEDFVWVSHHADGSVFPEIGPDGAERGWRMRPDAPVVAIELIAQRPTHHDLRIEVAEDAVPVCFRRRIFHLSGATGQEQRRETLTVIGWTRHHDARYWVIDGTGDSRVVSDWAAIE